VPDLEKPELPTQFSVVNLPRVTRQDQPKRFWMNANGRRPGRNDTTNKENK